MLIFINFFQELTIKLLNFKVFRLSLSQYFNFIFKSIICIHFKLI